MAIRKKIGKLLDQLSDEELATAYRRPDFPGRSSGRASGELARAKPRRRDPSAPGSPAAPAEPAPKDRSPRDASNRDSPHSETRKPRLARPQTNSSPSARPRNQSRHRLRQPQAARSQPESALPLPGSRKPGRGVPARIAVTPRIVECSQASSCSARLRQQPDAFNHPSTFRWWPNHKRSTSPLPGRSSSRGP